MFAREFRTTTATSLLFGEDFNQPERVDAATAYASSLQAPPGTAIGLTGTIPARDAQAGIISDKLPLIELVTVLLVSLTVAIYLRAAVAPLVTLVTIAVAYVVSIRIVALIGEGIGVSVPREVEPIIVALLFGVVTDYGLFYMSRFRRRLSEGRHPKDAARRTAAELTPIIFACGIAVSAGSAALIVADLGFLRAFGPGMAIAVLIALLVTMTLLPAMLALIGGRLFWPATPERGSRKPSNPGRTERLIRTAVRAPKRTIAACLVLLAIPSAGVLWMEVGNPLIRELPESSEPHRTFEELTHGFAPGVSAPTTLIVSAPGITRRRAKLAELQAVLGNQAGVAGVIGPASSPLEQGFGVVLSRTGDAARFVIISANDPLGADAVRLLDNLQARTADLLEAVGLREAEASYAGDTAILGEIIDTANDDLLKVGPLVLFGVALVLVAFLRALVAPLYLVILATLAPIASVGLAVGFFQGLLGQPELTYFVPLAASVLLISLGSDYNIFLVGRIWNEARRRPLAKAIVAAGSGASHAISAAGLVLSASFAALALVPIRTFQQLAFVLATGLLIDAFLVRSVLAPAVIALVGERSAWPGRGLSAAAPDE
jgi:RND superfamily putative drug exporter